MSDILRDDRRPSGGLGETIANVTVRGYFYELVKIVSGLNADVDVQYGSVDIRVEYTGKCICRIVPYRELIHLHIGESPVWEVRVRDEAAYLEAVDRILDVYLAIVAEASRPAKRYATTSYPGR